MQLLADVKIGNKAARIQSAAESYSKAYRT